MTKTIVRIREKSKIQKIRWHLTQSIKLFQKQINCVLNKNIEHTFNTDNLYTQPKKKDQQILKACYIQSVSSNGTADNCILDVGSRITLPRI